MPVAIAGLTFATVALLALVAFRPKDTTVSRRLSSGWSQDAIQERRLEGSAGSRWIGPFFSRVGTLLARLLPQNVVRGIEHTLIIANQPMSLSAFLTLWGASALLGLVVLLYVIRTIPDLSSLQVLGICFSMFLFFGIGPYAMIRRRARKRQKQIRRDLPYALDLVVTCVEAGLGVDAAFATVTEHTSGPISQTFGHYLREVGLGRARRDALADAADRSGVPDLIRIAAAVGQAEDMGTTLGDVLRTQAEELRLLRRQQAQEAAQRAPVWMTIPLIFCFLPALAAIIVVPSLLNFLNLISTLGLRPPS